MGNTHQDSALDAVSPFPLLFFPEGMRGGKGAVGGGALLFQRDPEGAQFNGGLEETILHLLCFLFQAQQSTDNFP